MKTQAWMKASSALALILAITVSGVGCSSGGGGHHSSVDGSSQGGGDGGTGGGDGGTGGGEVEGVSIAPPAGRHGGNRLNPGENTPCKL